MRSTARATPLLAGFAAGGLLSLALVLVTERGRLFHSVSR